MQNLTNYVGQSTFTLAYALNTKMGMVEVVNVDVPCTKMVE